MSQFKEQSQAPASELRQRVYTAIDKLSDRATFSQASSELHFMARTLPSHSLSTFLTCILSVDASFKSSVRVHCLNLLSLLAHVHNHSSLSPHVPKTILPSLLRRLRDPDSAVRSACAASVRALSPIGFSSLLGPLLSAVVAEQEFNAQIGSCLCLKAAVDGAARVEGSDEAELRRALPRLLKLVRVEGFKAKAALLGVVGSVVAVNGGGVVNGRGGLVGNVVTCAVEMLSCEDWAARKTAAEVLQAVALVANEEAAKEVKVFVVSSLESRRFDKVKATRATMNQALEAWKKMPGGPEEDLNLPRSDSSFSKGNGRNGRGSPLVSRRSSFAGIETPKPKKMMNKTNSYLAESPLTSISSSTSTSAIGPETPHRKKTMSKSRPSLSDDLTITYSSSVSKSSHDVCFDNPLWKTQSSKTRYSLPDGFPATISNKKSGNHKKALDWTIDIALPQPPPEKVVSEDITRSQRETVEVNLIKTTSTERALKARGWRSGSRVVPFIEEEEVRGFVVAGEANEEMDQNNVDILDMSLIRNQLLQIERQQSYLTDLLQKFMGKSQSGIDSLGTRVSGLERALDEISNDLAVQSRRIQSNGPAGTTCCPRTEFLSPNFWRGAEGRPPSSKSNSGSVPNKDGNIEVSQMDECGFDEQNRENANKNVKRIGQTSQRGRICSPRSFDAPSTAPCVTPGVRGA
ncbi:hypothetical protein Cgig2_018356 [Carnegiea gigantea]|uniref:TORTIFOLIA1/SINE1-2 N-terminal domain-containing protein n=1 Tax=Carnegiea gigantea TaxID=171969 RepID=A0A9Q1QRC5_9CARY|nr:hypothetical protein Cgig2_018356 [Carnegiea gigantea]